MFSYLFHLKKNFKKMAIIKHLLQLVYLFTDLQNWSG